MLPQVAFLVYKKQVGNYFFTMHQSVFSLIASLKNTSSAKKPVLTIRFSRKVLNVLVLMYQEGLLRSVESNSHFIKVYLNSSDKNDFANLKFYSDSSSSSNLSVFDLVILRNKNKFFWGVISTSKGLLPIDKAISIGLGGKIIFTI